MKHNDDHNERMDASMDCQRALELVPTFVDGEASESLAGAMRKHLIDCHDCRSAVQEETGLRQWFEPLAGEAGLADVEVPSGFAARVTELAFAGSASGSTAGSSAESTSGAGSSDLHAFKASAAEGQERRGPRAMRPLSAAAPADQKDSNSLGFLMGMTAAAAALMVGFTLMLAQDSRLEVGDRPLSADISLEEQLRKIEAENAAEEALMEAELQKANQETLAPADASDADSEEQIGSDPQNPK